MELQIIDFQLKQDETRPSYLQFIKQWFVSWWVDGQRL